MSKKEEFAQCSLERIVNGRLFRTVSFLPKKHAKLGNVLKLREDKDSEWTDGWQVISIGVTVKNFPYSQATIRNHRNNTGDSNPKPTN